MKQVKRINAHSTGFVAYINNVWKYRALIRIFAARDFKIQYAQTFFGVLWAFIQPLVAVVIYSVFFYKILGIQTADIPYPAFVLTGIMGWFNFTKLINETGSALVNNRDLIRKVEFPKLVLLISKMALGLIETGIIFLLLLIVMAIYGVKPSIYIVFVPFILLLNQFVGLSIGLWLSSLTIRYRDFYHIIPYLVSFGIWLTPVFYPTTILPKSLEYILYFNPVAAVIACYRWSILGLDAPSVYYMLSLVPVAILFITGFRFFIKIENEIVDFL